MPKRTDILENNLSPLGGEQARTRAQHKGRDEGGALTHYARNMRKSPTEAEKILWSHLRNKQFGVRFRRQHPMGKQYIADFICLERKLIIELDGGQHMENVLYDKERTRFLNNEGYTVLRFWNSEVIANMTSVLDAVHRAIHTPHDAPAAYGLVPSTPPQGVSEEVCHA